MHQKSISHTDTSLRKISPLIRAPAGCGETPTHFSGKWDILFDISAAERLKVNTEHKNK